MLKSIRDFFETSVAPSRGEPSRHALELATAALLIEVVRSDARITGEERDAVERAVREQFRLSADEAGALTQLAEEEVAQANDLFQFTSLINRAFTQEHKVRVIELMWRAALADDHISAHEQHVLRRIAGLLHVPDGDYIAAKARAQQSS